PIFGPPMLVDATVRARHTDHIPKLGGGDGAAPRPYHSVESGSPAAANDPEVVIALPRRRRTDRTPPVGVVRRHGPQIETLLIANGARTDDRFRCRGLSRGVAH